MVDISLEDFGRYMQDNVGFISPLLERGSDGIPRVIPKLTAEDLRNLSTSDTAQLTRVLGQLGIINTPDKLIELNSQFLARYNILPDDPRYEEELQRLLDSGSGRVLLEQARRINERFETQTSLDGNTDTTMIYLAEGDNPCPECAALNGTEGTYAELLANDQIPGARCLGGDACQCALIPTE